MQVFPHFFEERLRYTAFDYTRRKLLLLRANLKNVRSLEEEDCVIDETAPLKRKRQIIVSEDNYNDEKKLINDDGM